MEVQVYTADDIRKALGIGKTKTYAFLNDVYNNKVDPPFRVLKFGTSLRVTKASFDAWINNVA